MSADIFPAAKSGTKGYDREQVDEFFQRARAVYEQRETSISLTAADVRSARFALRRGGYSIAAVDGALDRLESAFIKRQRAAFVARSGQEQWLKRIADDATALYPRLLRSRGERFAHPRRGSGYRIEEVDDFLDRLTAYFDNGEAIFADDIRAVTFRPARGRKAYSENVVDAYLARAHEVLLAIE